MSGTTTTVLTAAAAQAADDAHAADIAALTAQLAAQDARITALEHTTQPPPVLTPSADGAKAASAGLVLVGDDLTSWRLAGVPGAYTVEFMPKGGAAWAAAGTTSAVTLIEKWKVSCCQTSPNSSGLSTPGWWAGSMATATTFGTWTAIAGDPSVPITPPPSGKNFYVQGGHIFYPNGSQFFGQGCCITDTGGTIGKVVSNAACMPLLGLLPHTTMVRIAIHTTGEGGLGLDGYNDAALVNAINWLTAKRIVVELGNYCFPGSVATGANLQAEIAYATAIGTKWLNNPYVWFGTCNEPSDNGNVGATMAEQWAFYQAIRATGNGNQIGLDVPNMYEGGAYSGSQIAHMTNVHQEPHMYATSPPCGGVTVADFQTIAQREVVGPALLNLPPLNSQRSADGVIPVIFGEFGDSTSGYSGQVDQYGMACVEGTIRTGYNYDGNVPWSYFWPQSGLGDKLVWHPDYDANGGTLTDYGKLAVWLMRAIVPPAA